MAGFGKVSFVSEYFNQKIVNSFWYRSLEWLPGQGNPFDDVASFVDAVLVELQAKYLDLFDANFRLQTAEGVGYDDGLHVVTASPILRTVNQTGTRTAQASNGAAGCAILSLMCGPQVQIAGTGHSLRNRGYLALGPMLDTDVDNYQHLTGDMFDRMESLAQHVDNAVPVVVPAVVLIPVRMHAKVIKPLGVKVRVFATYSDVLGYRVQRRASVRRSRFPEA